MTMPPLDPSGHPPPPVPSAAAQRGFRHWTVLILIFLASR
jgi:hypothetical protein